MIVSPFPKPTPEEAAEAVRDFVNNVRSKFIGMADLYYDGYYFPRNPGVAISLYRQAIGAKAEMPPQKRLTVLQRIVDYYLQCASYSEACAYQRMMTADQLFAFAVMYYNNNMLDSAAPCFEEYLRFDDAERDEKIKSRIILVNYFLEKRSYTNAATYICDFKHDGGNVIRDVLEQLEPEKKRILADYFYSWSKYPQAAACLSSLCKWPKIREIDPDYKLETMLVDSHCHCRDFKPAADVFQIIPPQFLSEEAVYQGIAAMRASGEKYSGPLFNACYNVCMQKPNAEKAPLYASLLEDSCLLAEDYPAAYFWASRTGDDRNLDSLKNRAREFCMSRAYAVGFSVFSVVLLLLLPFSLRIPALKELRGYGIVAFVSCALSFLSVSWYVWTRLKKWRGNCKDKARDKSLLAFGTMLLVGCGALFNGNLGATTEGRLLCAAEIAIGMGVTLYLLIRQKYPFTHLWLIMPMKRVIFMVIALALGIASGMALSVTFAHKELIWCGTIAFLALFYAMDALFCKKAKES